MGVVGDIQRFRTGLPLPERPSIRCLVVTAKEWFLLDHAPGLGVGYPRRMWRRYLRTNTRFLVLRSRSLFSRSKEPRA